MGSWNMGAFEIDAMRRAYVAVEPLDEGGRRRALMWLTAKLGVDMSSYDPVIARKALDAAAERWQ